MIVLFRTLNPGCPVVALKALWRSRRTRYTASVLMLLFSGLFVSAQETANPPFWRVVTPTRTLYLLGTVHLLPPEEARLAPHVREAVESSAVLYLEVDPAELTRETMEAHIAELAYLHDDVRVFDLLPDELSREVKQTALELGILPLQIERWQIWYVAQLLTSFAMLETGLDPNAGTDAQLHLAAARRQIPVRGLESAYQQIRFFSDLSTEAQIGLLQQSLSDIDTIDSDVDAILRAWRSNDVSYFDSMTDEMRANEELYRTIILNRHREWLPILQSLLEEPEGGDVFVAVGALHIYGPDGLLEQLIRLGFQAEPVTVE